jgi:hypothetical protein
MKQILISAAVAAIVSSAIVVGFGGPPRVKTPAASAGPAASAASATSAAPAASATSAAAGAAVLKLHYTDPLPEDVWINASTTAGADHRSLTDAHHSICFITKVELSGIRSPDDKSSCAMQVDGFTGFWDLAATVEEGGRSSVRCNARCLVWEEEQSR